jgi:hypothetical protein
MYVQIFEFRRGDVCRSGVCNGGCVIPQLSISRQSKLCHLEHSTKHTARCMIQQHDPLKHWIHRSFRIQFLPYALQLMLKQESYIIKESPRDRQLQKRGTHSTGNRLASTQPTNQPKPNP